MQATAFEHSDSAKDALAIKNVGDAEIGDGGELLQDFFGRGIQFGFSNRQVFCAAKPLPNRTAWQCGQTHFLNENGGWDSGGIVKARLRSTKIC